ncbi:hypothetical protein [Pseudoduganella lutea]|uniref:DUF3304 domain-containing protein n=1 Tax=Pseudoduganella lutea TaxID=321985 RepID=A0A4P6L2K7_9BURK|nr:hypothetical protein [Pseudoduganella lutea]QBE65856.1 hypothetical protein EWM63_25120 [Pseudoduganella lutea]
MKNWNHVTGSEKNGSGLQDRRGMLKFLGLGFLMPLAACNQGEGKPREHIVLNAEMFSYIDRPVFDIFFNGEDLGVMNNYGATGTIVGVRIPFGAQTLSWRLDGPRGMPRNGETVNMKNALVIAPGQIPPHIRYVGIHLYPDDTAEVTFSEGVPERTARGEEILAKRKQVDSK